MSITHNIIRQESISCSSVGASSTVSLSSMQSNSSRSTKSRKPRKRRALEFPLRLHSMLDDAEAKGFSHLISWMPDGDSFRIHIEHKDTPENDLQDFEGLLKDYFNQTKLRSFRRQLQNYGFDHDLKGNQRGLCKHEFFVRGRHELMSNKSLKDFHEARSSPVKKALVYPAPATTQGIQDVASKAPVMISWDGSTTSKLPFEYNSACSIPIRLNKLAMNFVPEDIIEDEGDDDEWSELERKLLAC